MAPFWFHYFIQHKDSRVIFNPLAIEIQLPLSSFDSCKTYESLVSLILISFDPDTLNYSLNLLLLDGFEFEFSDDIPHLQYLHKPRPLSTYNSFLQHIEDLLTATKETLNP